MDVSLAGRVAIAPGGSKGIGLAVVRGLAARGVHVIAGARVAGTAAVSVIGHRASPRAYGRDASGLTFTAWSPRRLVDWQGGGVFEGFRLERLDVGEVRLRVRYGGSGPAVLLVHGHPRTHATWYQVAPALVAAGYRVVCPDLRGYGQSSAPSDQPDHSQASKRAMAADLVRLMQLLGHDQYIAVGHDRGGYVVQRLALEHPAAVSRVVILGNVPIGEALARCDARFAQSWWHWFFMGQPAPLAERLITADPQAWYHLDAALMGEENYADVLQAVSSASVQHAMCEDYRAGLGPDRDADDADRAAGRQITAPLLVLWGSRDDLAELYDDGVLGVWQTWAPDLSGYALPGGHHMSEEAPEELTRAILAFASGEQAVTGGLWPWFQVAVAGLD